MTRTSKDVGYVDKRHGHVLAAADSLEESQQQHLLSPSISMRSETFSITFSSAEQQQNVSLGRRVAQEVSRWVWELQRCRYPQVSHSTVVDLQRTGPVRMRGLHLCPHVIGCSVASMVWCDVHGCVRPCRCNSFPHHSIMSTAAADVATRTQSNLSSWVDVESCTGHSADTCMINQLASQQKPHRHTQHIPRYICTTTALCNPSLSVPA